MLAAFPALYRHSQDTQGHQHHGEGSWLRDRRGRNRLDDYRGKVYDKKLLLSVPAASSWDFRNVLKRFVPRCPESWWQDTPQPRLAPLQLLAALLAESPERLPLPLRSRSFGEPCPEAVALAAEAQQLDNRLPPGPPARQLYAALRDQHTRPSPAPRKSTERLWRGRGRPPPGAWRR
jgi:hypothetical protein